MTKSITTDIISVQVWWQCKGPVTDVVYIPQLGKRISCCGIREKQNVG